MATSDVRAQARYYAAGTIARFPIYTLAAGPRETESDNDGLAVVPIDDTRTIEEQRAVERQVLGHRRSDEVAMHHLMARGFQIDPWINFLMSDRPFGRFDRFVPFAPPMFL